MSLICETILPSVEATQKAVDWAQIALVIPTVNAGKLWGSVNAAIRLQGFPVSQVLIVDSSSEDATRELAAAEGYRVLRIDRSDFNHGGTRQLALSQIPWASVVVYLTQDAVMATANSLNLLLSAFDDELVAAAYGRQLPRLRAGPIEAHARLFNYPPESHLHDFESRHSLGIKAAFLSNSFAAYRVSALMAVGGFPTDVIMAEDATVAGLLLLAGWKTAYVADAQVYHSHAYTLAQEFQRYFDIGVYHRQEMWLREAFGDPGGEGKRFVMSELTYLAPRYLHLVPYALLRTASKAIGYELGYRRSALSRGLSRRLSSNKGYWDSLTRVR